MRLSACIQNVLSRRVPRTTSRTHIVGERRNAPDSEMDVNPLVVQFVVVACRFFLFFFFYSFHSFFLFSAFLTGVA